MIFSIGSVRMLKGAPLSVLMVLALVRQPVTVEFLEGTTGYSYKVVSSALRFLGEMQYITRIGRYGWLLATAVQLPLPIDELPEPMGEDTAENRVGNIPTPGDEHEGCRQDEGEGVGFFPTPEVVLDENGAEIANRVGISPTPDALKLSKLRDIDSDNDDLLNLRAGNKNFETLQQYGFWGEKARQVAFMPHVTEKLISYWAQNSKTLALALFRIRKNWRVPRDWIPPEPGTPPCPECGKIGEHSGNCRYRYVSGEFSEIIRS